jgi:hypothetical protein
VGEYSCDGYSERHRNSIPPDAIGRFVIPAMARRHTHWITMIAVAALFPRAGTATGQGVSTPVLKAAFLLNFVKFAQWPDDVVPPGVPLMLCVLGDDEVARSLDDVTRGSAVDGHDLIVKRLIVGGATRDCRLLYLSGMVAGESIALVQTLKNAPTLTVSDLNGFAQSGGIINFTVEDERIRFVINVDAASRAHLHLSSKLLSLAKIVKN